MLQTDLVTIKDMLDFKFNKIYITKIKNEFNWIPKTNLEKGLSDTIKYYLN